MTKKKGKSPRKTKTTGTTGGPVENGKTESITLAETGRMECSMDVDTPTREEILPEGSVIRTKQTVHEIYQRILNPKTTFEAALESPEILPLIFEKLKDEKDQANVLKVLSRLVWAFQSATRFAEDYLVNLESPLKNLEAKLSHLSITEPRRKKARQSPEIVMLDNAESELPVILSCLLILMKKVSRHSYSHWSTQEFLTLRSSRNTGVRWCAVQCIRLLLALTENETRKMLNFWRILESEDQEFALTFQREIENIQFKISRKTENLASTSRGLLDEAQGFANIGGLLIKPKFGTATTDEDPVTFPAFSSYLKDIAIHVTNGTPVCVIGPIGSGKSTLIRHVASIHGRRAYPELISVQMSDQVDARLLLGSYHSTDLPGQFVWKPGCLTRAVLNGHWILFEDLDSAPTDVITLLSGFIDSRTLSVPGYGEISHVHSDLRLFSTCRVNDSHVFRSGDKIGKNWMKILIHPYSSADIKIIVSNQHTHLQSVIDRLVEMYDAIKSFTNDRKGNSGSNRPVSIRDFLKLCCRIPGGLDFSETSSALTIFQEALDLFAVSSVKFDIKEARAEIIGKHLNLLKSKTEYYLTMYRPHSSICSKTNSLICGRFTLPIYQDLVHKRDDKEVYSLTKRTCCLLETIAGCVKNHEPVLLIGETGVGKTSCVQYLSKVLNQKLIVVNLNRQSDSADLLGGYKPVELKYIFLPLREEFEKLFSDTFNRESNVKFLNHIMTCFANKRWKDLVKLMKHVEKSALSRCSSMTRRDLYDQWLALYGRISRVEAQMLNESGEESPFAFSFIEGTLINAIRTGHWILLDEINLATSEMLQCLSSILDEKAQIHLWEKGDEEPIQRHPNFHLFAAMNPSTDVGKKDLPMGIRNRFTEFYVGELVDSEELRTLVADYLREMSLSSSQVDNIVQFYLKIRNMSQTTLVDGLGKKPHFSLRTLCRALKISSLNLFGSVSRSLFESFCLSFLTQLDFSSHPVVEQLIAKHIFGKSDVKSITNQPLPCPKNQKAIQVEGYWIPIGDQNPKDSNKYVLTHSVRRNLRDIARIVSAGKLPVLIQGETSVGKTSLIQYLAELSGNRCYRINNHQHTDLQEYIGSYQSDAQGKLVFTEGVLVQAMRRGEWVILDELNLAPSEILEALNRLLDDNRQLFITETGITVTAHPRFMLFATQNPPGLYGGRKLLSRAFRNRFVELHFDEIPSLELEQILHLRCDIPASYCKKFIAVMKDLQIRRKASAALQGKHGFATLRDLFRWAERYRLSGDQKTKFYDWDQHLADEGYLVLAGKERKLEEADVIREVMEKNFKRKVDPDDLFTLHEKTSEVTKSLLEAILNAQLPGYTHIVWTYQMRRLAVLIGKAMLFKEPILLVGETGVGKTTIVQLLSDLHYCQLFSINCHMNSEGSDFLGGLRPVRDHTEQTDRLFEWVNGPLVEAMETGGIFLADEISLADDSVLERINSVLEPERTLLIAEKGEEIPRLVVANEKFHFVGTMNPGGDYGKKELSPALRNRLTEIWCDANTDKKDLIAIVEHNLSANLKSRGIGAVMTSFVEWIKQSELGQKCTISVRDYLSWVNFINHITTSDTCVQPISIPDAIVHGACLAFLDGLGTGNTSSDNASTSLEVRRKATEYLEHTIVNNAALTQLRLNQTYELLENDYYLSVGPFAIPRKHQSNEAQCTSKFALKAPTTLTNTLRLLRAMQVKKPILLEGSPGVGKTALVTAVAKITGFSLTRINLSEQTDISDLFGADLPVEGKDGGHFEWRDGPLLQALKENSWILLDELNLASQSVLEGLNACLDHRGSVYIPELNKTFRIFDSENTPNFSRIFGCQNPVRQGGARKGLPKSFLNRFTQVHIESLTAEDFSFVLHTSFPKLPKPLVDLMSRFSSTIQEEICQKGAFGSRGSPWDINLRDLMRWAHLTVSASESAINFSPESFVDLIYGLRMRCSRDRAKVLQLFSSIYKETLSAVIDSNRLRWGRSEMLLLEGNMVCGHSAIQRIDRPGMTGPQLIVLQKDLPFLEALSTCLKIGWMPILVGPSGCGKTSLVKLTAQLCGRKLQIMHPSPEMDTIELLGGFEQADIYRKIDEVKVHLSCAVQAIVKHYILEDRTLEDLQCLEFLDLWSSIKRTSHLSPLEGLGHQEEIKRIESRLKFLQSAYLRCKTFLESESCNPKEAFSSNENESEKGADLEINRIQERQHLERIGTELEQICTHLKSGIQTGAFQWIDSLLIKAVVNGEWLLVDGANRCSAAVLDRLNSLMESDGSLHLSERGCIDGKIIEIKPHPEFRLILALDPVYGEISRAMRNRGVEIYMDASETSDPVELINEDRIVNNTIGMALLGTNEDAILPSLSEFGINCLDLDALMKTEGLRDRALRKEVLSLHHQIDEAVASAVNCEPQMFQVIASSKSIVQQLQQGIQLEEAMQRALLQTYSFSRVDHVNITALIETLVNGLEKRIFRAVDDTAEGLGQKPMMLPVSFQNFMNSQLYRLWKYMETFESCMECHKILNANNQWIGKCSGSTSELLEDFLILSVFSRVVKHDACALSSALGIRIPRKGSFLSNLANVLNCGELGSFVDWKQQSWDIQEMPHVIAKLCRANEEQKGNHCQLLQTLKMSLLLYYQNEIFHKHSSSVRANPRKGTVGFVAKNVTFSEAGNVSEFLHCFWKLVTSFDSLFEACLKTKPNMDNNLCINAAEERNYGNTDEYANLWLAGMKIPLWGKRLDDLCARKCTEKLPNEKVIAKVNLLIQWISEQVLPTMTIISGEGTSPPKECRALLENCFKTIDHSRDHQLLRQNKLFRSMNEFRPFLTDANVSSVELFMSSLLTIWSWDGDSASQSYMLKHMLSDDGKALHANLVTTAMKLLRANTLTSDEIQVLRTIVEKLEALKLMSKKIELEEKIDGHQTNRKEVESTENIIALEEFLRIASESSPIASSSFTHSTFISPFHVACNVENGMTENFLRFIQWEEAERFRQTFVDFPIGLIQNSCLVPIFASRILLDRSNFVYKVPTLESNGVVERCQRKLLALTTSEISCNYDKSRNSVNFVNLMWKESTKLVDEWKSIFANEEGIFTSRTSLLSEWEIKLQETKLNSEDHSQRYLNLVKLGTVFVEAASTLMEVSAYLPVVDPVVEKEVLAEYLDEDISYFETWVASKRLHQLALTGLDILQENTDSSVIHPYISNVVKDLISTRKICKESRAGIVPRPDPPAYNSLLQDIKQFVSTMGSFLKSKDITNSALETICNNGAASDLREIANSILIQCRNWLDSHRNFVRKIWKNYWYWDVTASFLYASIQASVGFNLIYDCMFRHNSSIPNMKSTLFSMVSFPKSLEFSCVNPSGLYEDIWAYQRAKKRIFMASLISFGNKLCIRKALSKKSVSQLQKYCEEIAHWWTAQEAETQRKKEEEDAFYVFKGKERSMEKTDEEQEQFDLMNIFPSFEEDYHDLEQISSLGDGLKIQRESDTEKLSELGVLKSEDVEVFLKVYSLAMSYVTSHWLRQDLIDQNGILCDAVTPFMNLFEIGCHGFMDRNNTGMFDREDEKEYLLGANVAAYQLSIGSKAGQWDPVNYDFYHDPNIAEAQKLQSLFSGLKHRISELLEEWPDHPALQQVVKIVQRIESFRLDSPIMRFLTGLELLLGTAQEWETVASKRVSIAAHLAEITNLIICWRKLELRFWKNLSEQSFKREQEEGNKWWFYLFSATMEIISDPTRVISNSVLKLFQQFMETSTIGQFSVRLRLLTNLHRHLHLLENYGMIVVNQRIQSYLWNTISYYKQFESQVALKLKDLKSPIEKKMKEFVKISRWNDANFYALADSVKKSQKMLNKLLSEYKKVLKTSVSSVLIADVGIQSVKLEKCKLPKFKLNDYVVQKENTEAPDERLAVSISQKQERQQRFRKLPKLLTKAKEVCMNSYSNVSDISRDKVNELNELTGTIIEKVHELQNLPIPEKGNQRKKSLHNVHNIRRKSLADLFKTLQSLNLSHKRGIIRIENYEKGSNVPYDFLIQPVDVTAGWIELLNSRASYPVDKELATVWKGCDDYFQKCIGRISVLLKAFQSPSKELGPVIIERCKGFIADLFSVACDQKLFIAKLSKYLWELRVILDYNSSECDFSQKMNSIGKRIFDRGVVLEYELIQYRVLFESLVDIDDSIRSSSVQSLSVIIKKIEEFKSSLRNLFSSVDESFNMCHPVTPSVIHDSLKSLNSCVSLLESIAKSLMGNSLLEAKIIGLKESLQHFIGSCSLEIEELVAKNEDCNSSEEVLSGKFRNASNAVLESILLTFQKIEKLHFDLYQESCPIQENPAIEILKCFDLDSVVHDGLKLRSLVSHSTSQSYDLKRKVLLHLKPLMQQYYLCAHFYLKSTVESHRETTKLLSVLSSVFGTLAQKGFCLPEDYENEAMEEGPELDAKSGMGLGEGETTSDAKDVSDRIESEDQLEDTMKAGETAEPADKDLNDDEKGVEMGDDFEGKQQEKEKKSDEDDNKNDSGSSDEEEEMDKQMGDVEGEDKETLDDQMWGGSSDEEDDEMKDEKDEKGKGVAQKSEPELAPKDSDLKDSEEKEQQDNQEGDNDEEKNKKDFNEMDEGEINDDQTDPYHGQNQPEEEPEDLDLPDDLQLDDDTAKDDGETQEENPFDLDTVDREDFPELDENEESKDEDAEGQKEMSDQEDDPNDNAPQVDVDMANEEEGEAEESKPDKTDEPMEIEEPVEGESPAEEDAVNKDSEKKPTEDQVEPSAEAEAANAETATQPDQNKSKKDEAEMKNPNQEEHTTENDQSTGQVESEQGSGQEGQADKKEKSTSTKMEEDDKATRKPGETDTERALSSQESTKSRLKTLQADENKADKEGDINDQDEDKETNQNEADLYQHIKQAEKYDAVTVDNATKEQVEKQKGSIESKEEESDELPKMDETEEKVESAESETENVEESAVEQYQPDLIKGLPQDKKKNKKPRSQSEVDEGTEEKVDVEGEKVPTYSVQRPAESVFHTQLNLLDDDVNGQLREEDVEMTDVPLPVTLMQQEESTSISLWHELERKTLPLSQELCEQLRLILEPTQASRLKGDYKTGKRLNMRKVIPYIASGFRKDKIWLRRTQPSKREYQIVLALDDSASMSDNQSKQMAFSAVAVVAKALTLLEAGQLSVLSFGEEVKLLHPFEEPFTDASGSRLLQQFTFAQRRTRIVQLMEQTSAVFNHAKSMHMNSSAPVETAQLLIIISDGRAVCHEGSDKVKAAVRRAREQNIFIVFVIVDNPENKHSILDIQQPIFEAGNKVQFVKYMDNFPFPFYLILRDLSSLPSVLSDALRQWFELVTSSNR